MKIKLISIFLAIFMILSSFFITVSSLNVEMDSETNNNKNSGLLDDAELPEWYIGSYWKYDMSFAFLSREGTSVKFTIEADISNMYATVIDITNDGEDDVYVLDLNGYILWINGVPLPVELISFSAVLLENKIQLKWRTETEVSNYGFEILRSAQDDKWDVLGFVEGHGNSNSPKDYSFVDESITAGKYSYRLKQIDTDGKFEYSKVIEVDLGSPTNYELSQNYPNPFNPSTTIRFSVLESSFISLSVYNSLGEKVEELVNEVKEPGVHTIEFFAQNLPSGTYFYRIQTTDFVQTKKMILVK